MNKKFFTVISLALVFSMLLPYPCIQVQGNANLISNGSFEQPIIDEDIPEWNKWTPSGDPVILVVDDEAIDGAHSVHIIGDSKDDRGALVKSINVEEGETYLLSYWGKTKDVEAQGTGVTTRVQFKDNKNVNTANMIYVGSLSATTDWTRFAQILEIPKRTSYIKVEPILDQAIGEVWFDNFVLEKIDTSKPPEFIDFSTNLLDTGAVRLNWNVTYGYPNNVMFEIYRSTEKDFEAKPDLLFDTTMENYYIDRTTALDQTYYYRIVLIDESGNTSITDAKGITITQALPPCTPVEFKSIAHIDGGAWLSWELDGSSRGKAIRLYASNRPMDNPNAQYLIDEISIEEAAYHYRVSDIPSYYGITVVDADGGESDWMTTELRRILPPVKEITRELEHPYLFFHAEDIPDLKRKISNYEFANKAFDQLIARADLAVETILDPRFQLPDKNDNRHDQLADQARYAALAYLLTEDPRYKNTAIKILIQYAKHYADYPLEGTYDGRLLHQTLNESGWLIDFAWAYDMMYQELSEEQRQQIETDVLYNAVDVISRYKRGLSNWQVWHNAAIGMVGLVTKDQALLERVLEDPEHGFKYQMANGIRQDGMWWEESNSYHEYTLQPFIYFAEAAYNSNLNMYALKTQEGISLKSMFDGLLNYIFADMTRPAIGNTSVYSPLKSGFLYEIAYKQYQDPKYAWLIQQTIGKGRSKKTLDPYWAFIFAEPELPDVDCKIGSEFFAPEGKNIMGSSLYSDSGMAILRNHSPEGNATNVSMTWSPYGTTNGHQHSDMLSIMLYGNGETLLTEAGSLGYSNSDHISWAKQTLAHNTLVVDETSQYPQRDLKGLWDSDSGRPSSGVLKNIHIGPLLKTITAESDNVYDGVHLERSLIMVGDYVLDWFQTSSDTKHIYDMPYHVNGHLIDSSLELKKREEPFRDWGGYQHISQAKSSITDNQWSTTWQGNNGSRLNITMLEMQDTEVVHGVGLNELVMARRQGKNTDFMTVLQPLSEGIYPREVQTLQIQADSPARAIKIKDDTNTDVIAAGMSGEMKKVSGMVFDGGIAFTQWATNGQTHNFALVNGQYYQDTIHEIQLLEEGSVQFTELNRPHTFRLDYSGAEQNTMELIMQLHPKTKVMSYDPMTNGIEEHEFTLTKGEGSVRHLKMKLQSGMSYILATPPYKQDFDLDLSAYAVPLYDIATETKEPTGKVVSTSENLEGIIIEGEDYTGQGGGFVEVTEKPGASGGKAFRLWDYAGHWLEWTGNIPETGIYQVVIRYSTDTETSYREFTIADGQRHVFYFPSTYGWNNWNDVVLSDLEGNPLMFELTGGEHIIHMMNLSSPLNIDYIKLIKVG